MLLVVRNHGFPPFGGITSIVTLANKKANHITHSLKQNRIWLTTIIHHKECQVRDNLQ